jgi:hypothetical protein
MMSLGGLTSNVFRYQTRQSLQTLDSCLLLAKCFGKSLFPPVATQYPHSTCPPALNGTPQHVEVSTKY